MRKKEKRSTIKTLAFALGCSTILAAPAMLEASSLNAVRIVNDANTEQSDALPTADALPNSPANESNIVSEEEMQELSTDMRTVTVTLNSNSNNTIPVRISDSSSDGFSEVIMVESSSEPQTFSFELNAEQAQSLEENGLNIVNEGRSSNNTNGEIYLNSVDIDGQVQSGIIAADTNTPSTEENLGNRPTSANGDNTAFDSELNAVLIPEFGGIFAAPVELPALTTPQNNFVSLPERNIITISASGDSFDGAPIMALVVNGNEEGRVRVQPEDGENNANDGDVRDYMFEVEGEIEALDISFINDAYGGEGRDRNLYIHDIRINDIPLSETDGMSGDLNHRLEEGPLALFQNGTVPFDIEQYNADVAAAQNSENTTTDTQDAAQQDNSDVTPQPDEQSTEQQQAIDSDAISNTIETAVTDALANNDLEEPESMVDFVRNLVDDIVNSILSSIFGITPDAAPTQAAPQATVETPATVASQAQSDVAQTQPPAPTVAAPTPAPAPVSAPTSAPTPTPVSSGSATPALTGNVPSGGTNQSPSTSSGGGSVNNSAPAPVTDATPRPAPAPTSSGGGAITGSVEAENTAQNSAPATPTQTAQGNSSGEDGQAGPAVTETPTSDDSAINNGVSAGEITGEEIDLSDVDTDSLGLEFGQFNEGSYEAGNCEDSRTIEGVQSPFNSGDYCEALEKGLFFFYANRSGSAEGNPIEWRGDTDLNDGSDNGVDLVGGWYDAGDHIKFDLPGATSASMMAWSGVKFYDGYKQSGLLSELKKHLAWANAYFMKTYDNNGTADPADDRLFVQVGDGSLHQYSGRPEESTLTRTSYFVSNGTPATEVAAEKAAAFTSFALLSQIDGDYDSADALLTAARSIYEYAYQFQGKYSDSVPQANPYYTSVSGYKDELAWGAAWLYKATGDPAYLARAEENYDAFAYGVSFDEKKLMTMSLMYDVTGDMRYAGDLMRAMDEYQNGQNGIVVLPGTATNGGLNIRQDWGSCNMTMGLAQSVVTLAKSMTERGADNGRIGDMLSWASDQADYCLGDNPQNYSYMIGFGDNFPKSPHHRGANNRRGVDPAQFELTGAMVAGPKKSGEYNDTYSDWVTNEVGTSYNAPMVGTLGGLYEFAIGGAAAADDVSREGVTGAGVAGLGIDRTSFGTMTDPTNFNTQPINFNQEPAEGSSSGVGNSQVSGGEVTSNPSSSFTSPASTPGEFTEGTAGPVAATRAPASVIAMCGGLVNAEGTGQAQMVGGLGHQYPEMGKLMNVHDVWEGATSIGIDAQGFFDSFT